MSTMLEQKPLTVVQRTAKANEEAAFILGLEDVKLVGAVLLERAVGELRRNEAFRQDVREAYQAAAKPKRSRARAATGESAQAQSGIEAAEGRRDAPNQHRRSDRPLLPLRDVRR